MAGSPFDATPQNSQSKPASLSQQAIIWLVVLSCIVVAAFIIITCLLCKCRNRRNSKDRVKRGYSVSDGRNDFTAWNKHAPPPVGSLPPAPQYGGYGASVGPTPLPKAAARPVGSSAVMEPMIVEDAGEGNGWQTQRRKGAGNNRYYSAWTGRISKRFSQQIGTAV